MLCSDRIISSATTAGTIDGSVRVPDSRDVDVHRGDLLSPSGVQLPGGGSSPLGIIIDHTSMISSAHLSVSSTAPVGRVSGSNPEVGLGAAAGTCRHLSLRVRPVSPSGRRSPSPSCLARRTERLLLAHAETHLAEMKTLRSCAGSQREENLHLIDRDHGDEAEVQPHPEPVLGAAGMGRATDDIHEDAMPVYRRTMFKTRQAVAAGIGALLPLDASRRGRVNRHSAWRRLSSAGRKASPRRWWRCSLPLYLVYNVGLIVSSSGVVDGTHQGGGALQRVRERDLCSSIRRHKEVALAAGYGLSPLGRFFPLLIVSGSAWG